MAEAPNETPASGSETPDLDVWLAMRRECPHCGERSSGSATDLAWYSAHISNCTTLAVDRSNPMAKYVVTKCAECALLISSPLLREHQRACQQGNIIANMSMRRLAEQAAEVIKKVNDKSRRQADDDAKWTSSVAIGFADCLTCTFSADASKVSQHAARAAEFAHEMAMEAVLALQCEIATGKSSFFV